MCADVGLPVQDVTAIFAKDPQPSRLFLPDQGPFSPAGHAAVAAWLSEALPKLMR